MENVENVIGYGRKLFSFSVLLVMILIADAQEVRSGERNAFFVELTTHKPVYSLNYDRVFSVRDRLRYSYRAGLSIGKGYYYFPTGLNLITGNRESHLEVSLAFAPYVKHYGNRDRSAEEWDTFCYLIPGLGYRFQPPDGGPFIKLTIAPAVVLDVPAKWTLEMHSEVLATAYCSIGYCF